MLDAVHRLFNHPTLRKVLVKSRVLLGARRRRRDHLEASTRAGCCRASWCRCSARLIQLWCFASLDKGRTLAFNGPYALVRNPMYLGRYFILLGGVMLLGNWWVLLLFTVVYYFYMVNRVQREEEYLRGPLGAPYEEYLRTVNRFLPGAPKPGSQLAFWDWKLLKRNHGTTNLVATLAFWAIAWACVRYGLALIASPRASVHAAAVRVRARGEQRRRIDHVEAVGAAAEFAAHLDLAEFLEHRIDFVAAQRPQHVADPLARAAAAEEHRRGLEHAHVVLGEQPPQQARGRRARRVRRRSPCRRPAARAARHPRSRPPARRPHRTP